MAPLSDSDPGQSAPPACAVVQPREQFRSLVNGRTEQQVLDALGKPDETQDQEGFGKFWYYRGVAPDPVTGKKTAQVQIVFEGGMVTSVNFN